MLSSRISFFLSLSVYLFLSLYLSLSLSISPSHRLHLFQILAIYYIKLFIIVFFCSISKLHRNKGSFVSSSSSSSSWQSVSYFVEYIDSSPLSSSLQLRLFQPTTRHLSISIPPPPPSGISLVETGDFIPVIDLLCLFRNVLHPVEFGAKRSCNSTLIHQTYPPTSPPTSPLFIHHTIHPATRYIAPRY